MNGIWKWINHTHIIIIPPVIVVSGPGNRLHNVPFNGMIRGRKTHPFVWPAVLVSKKKGGKKQKKVFHILKYSSSIDPEQQEHQ